MAPEKTNLNVMVQITHSASLGDNGEIYITPPTCFEEDVVTWFAGIRESLNLAEQRALAILREDKE